MTRYYVTAGGTYIGGFAGQSASELEQLLPAGAIEVPAPPEHAADTWDGTKFLAGQRGGPLADPVAEFAMLKARVNVLEAKP